MIRLKRLYFTLTALVMILLAGSCREDYVGPFPDSDGEGRILFGASLQEGPRLSTRAESEGNPGLDSVYVAHTPWNQDFYIQLNTVENGSPVTRYGVYGVPSAYEGRLDPKEGSEPLNWQNLNEKHTFYAWTVPWMSTATGDASGAGQGASGAAEKENSGTFPADAYYTPSEEPLPVYFYNSSEQYGFNLNKNNSIYEGFIGAKSGSYSYNEHGKYVDLTFHHLVSKIRIDNLILLKTDGSIQKYLKADMTFVGMPIKATFYPHPKPSDVESGAPANWRPYVGGPYIESPDTGVTYFIQNEANVEDIFYVCPEVDFSDIDYQIKITTEGYETLQTYYGTFKDVVFKRTSGWGYDRGDDETGDDQDSRILHAGEEMHLDIVLIPGNGPGLKVIIEDWSTDKPVESQYHPHQGFYSDAELQDLLDLMFKLNSSTYGQPSEELDLLFDMYGYTGEDGKKYFPLYENVTPKKNGNTSNIFPIPPGYIIDGMGHTVTLKTNTGNYWDEGTSNYFNVGGECRDIYFSDENGENTIYIDKEGYIWVTQNGRLVPTENQLPSPMPEGKKGFDISCRSGKIRETGYFNDNITG